MTQNTRYKFLKDLGWQAILKDVAKFYIYLILLYGLAFLLVWGQAYISLENSNISIDKALSDPLDADIEIKEFNLETHETIAKQMGQYMFILVCFGVFFAVPPKRFPHVAIVAGLVFMTGSLPIFYDTVTEWLHKAVYFLGSVLFAWLSSHIWFRFQNRAVR